MKNFPIMARFDTGLDQAMVSNIRNYIKSSNNLLQDATIGGSEDLDGRVDKSIRNCFVFPINPTYWLTPLLSSYINEVNNQAFNFDLTTWHGNLQYILYDGKGSGYKWHCDNEFDENETGVRKLSLVLSLSNPDEYEGGEFQIMLNGNSNMETLKLKLGECIVFPSIACHRVRPLKSGKRSVIVGWYGGPDFR